MNLDFLNWLPLDNPEYLIAIPFIFVILLMIISKDFVKLNLDNFEYKRRKRAKVYFFLSRFIILVLLLVAIAGPYIEVTEEHAGDPRIMLLIDESNSMNLLNTDFLESFKSELKSRVPLITRTIGSGDDSSLGDGILDNLEQDTHVLLVSDGNVISGTGLDDVAFFAVNQLNSSISAIKLDEKNADASVFITGPETVVAGTSNTYVVEVTSTNKDPVKITLMVDGQKVYDQSTTERKVAITKEFNVGTHKLEAFISSNDANERNNIFYKTVNVLEKPKILLLSQRTDPLESVLRELYTVDKKTSLPNDISDYYAIVANDVPASTLNNVQTLHDYLIDEQGGYYGGGLVVIGGFNSFDRGNYQNAPIESLLPVTVGKGTPKKGNDNIVIVLDISGGTTGVRYEKECDAEGNCKWVEVVDEVSALDIIKAQAHNLISSEKNILATNKVGVVAFGVQNIVEQGEDFQAADTVRVIEPIDNLYNNQARLQEKIPRLVGGGPSEIGIALRQAYNMLQTTSGQKYVLLLTDGNVAPRVQQEASSVISSLQKRGVQTFIYGVGRSKENVKSDFLTSLAKTGDGLYEGPVFTTAKTSPARISIQWGDPDQKGFGDQFGLITFSLTHFITQGLDPTATLNGFNQVTPKSAARMLITTDFGQPALTTWEYGNGRVAALTVFTGSGLGELLNADNSLLITRVVNWAIGDPQRKEDFYVSLSDARINEPTTISVNSKETLSSSEVEFSKQGNVYSTTITPDTVGFNQFFGADFAVNYIREEQYVGMNPYLNDTLAMTNGKLFSHEDVNDIVAHVAELSKRRVIQKELFIWPFVSTALIIFLIEIFIRRLNKKRD